MKTTHKEQESHNESPPTGGGKTGEDRGAGKEFWVTEASKI